MSVLESRKETSIQADQQEKRTSRSPETSVVITCFNYGRYLKECLYSVLDQTYKDYEIIVVDDGSTDDTPEIMEGFTRLPNLSYIRQENQGQARAKNRGIQSAKGRYVAFLDADDLWETEKLGKQIPRFASLSVGVVYSRARLIDEEGNPLPLESSGEHLKPRAGWVAHRLFLDNFVWFSSSVVRRECLERFGVFDESLPMGIDWDLWLRISTQFEFDFVDEPLLLYRIGHSGQMSRKVEIRQKCSDRIMESFLHKHPGVLSDAVIREGHYLTFCNRGAYYRREDRRKSYEFFLKAIRTMPFKKEAYIGIVKNLVGC